MASSKQLAKHYEKLSEHERARLMIHADLNDDTQEFQRLKVSAPTKTFSIRGDKESEIGDAWFRAHQNLLLGKYLIDRKTSVVKNLFEGDELNQHLEVLGQDLKALELAFCDGLEKAHLPIYQSLLEAFFYLLPGTPISEAESQEIRHGKHYDWYQQLFSID